MLFFHEYTIKVFEFYRNYYTLQELITSLGLKNRSLGWKFCPCNKGKVIRGWGYHYPRVTFSLNSPWFWIGDGVTIIPVSLLMNSVPKKRQNIFGNGRISKKKTILICAHFFSRTRTVRNMFVTDSTCRNKWTFIIFRH